MSGTAFVNSHPTEFIISERRGLPDANINFGSLIMEQLVPPQLEVSRLRIIPNHRSFSHTPRTSRRYRRARTGPGGVIFPALPPDRGDRAGGARGAGKAEKSRLSIAVSNL